MDAILTAITNFFSLIVSIIEFIFKGLITLFNLLYQGIRILTKCIAILPTPFTVGASALIVICVLYKILGRESRD